MISERSGFIVLILYGILQKVVDILLYVVYNVLTGAQCLFIGDRV